MKIVIIVESPNPVISVYIKIKANQLHIPTSNIPTVTTLEHDIASPKRSYLLKRIILSSYSFSIMLLYHQFYVRVHDVSSEKMGHD